MDDLFWNQLKIGEEEAYQSLYDKYADMLYEYGMKIEGNSDMVSEAIQSLFVYIFEKRRNLSQPVSMKAYLCASLKRLMLKELGKDERYKTVSLDDTDNQGTRFDLEISMNETLERGAYKEELLETLQAALNKLTAKQREIIYLKYYKGLKNEEVAIITGMKIKTVKNLSSLAIANLRDITKDMIESYLIIVLFYIWTFFNRM